MTEFGYADSLSDLVAARADAAPMATAVVDGDREATYAELDALADSLAGHLAARLSACGEQVVAVCLERSLDLVVSLLAAWRAGAAVLPLDPAAPAERTAWQVADAGASLVLDRLALDGMQGAAPLATP